MSGSLTANYILLVKTFMPIIFSNFLLRVLTREERDEEMDLGRSWISCVFLFFFMHSIFKRHSLFIRNHARELGVDKAGFKVTSKTPSVVTVYWRSENCYKVEDVFLRCKEL